MRRRPATGEADARDKSWHAMPHPPPPHCSP